MPKTKLEQPNEVILSLVAMVQHLREENKKLREQLTQIREILQPTEGPVQ